MHVNDSVIIDLTYENHSFVDAKLLPTVTSWLKQNMVFLKESDNKAIVRTMRKGKLIIKFFTPKNSNMGLSDIPADMWMSRWFKEFT